MSDIRSAAAALEARPSHEGIPYERYTDELWQMIDARLSGFGPPWLRHLSKDFRLGGVCFQLKVDQNA